MAISPAEFATKWAGSTRTERAASQEHFLDLCRMVGVPTPNEADPTGEHYAFEKGAEKTAGGGGFADVWRSGYFAWEYKGKRKNLATAYQQLLQYREALNNPPLLVVCDLDRFEIHTNFTNTPATVHSFSLEDLLETPEEPLRILRAVMKDPEGLRPGKTRDELTAEAAEKFASLADRLRARDHEPHRVAHFLNKLLFCMFAEDSGLLPERLIERLTRAGKADTDLFARSLRDLFSKMSSEGGMFGAERIDWFNGGLFDGDDVLELDWLEIKIVHDVSRLDWSQVEPAIFGTLFERGLDPSKRSQLGAHYTDRESILALVTPVLTAPLREEFQMVQERVTGLLAENKRITSRTPLERNPRALTKAFLDRLRAIRVLDPACGSGNFLYVALQELKDLEREVILWTSLTLKVPLEFPRVGPEAVRGIELNTYAAEMARVVIWIGEIQWMLSNGFAYLRDPILRPLESIECRDAVLDLEGPEQAIEPEWPDADVIVGNPPFLGGKLMRKGLGDEYVDALFSLYRHRVPAEADFVTYWHEKARAMVAEGRVKRVGLLATQSIRGGASRRVLERIKDSGDVFFARSDQDWIVEGAAVHVSFVGFDDGSERPPFLDGEQVDEINANLTSGLDLTKMPRLKENKGIAFMGDTKGGPFDIDGQLAQELTTKANPDGRQNRDVLRPWVNTKDVTGLPRGKWIIDFGVSTSEQEAALYEAPFDHLKAEVAPTLEDRRDAYTKQWWLHTRPRPEMRKALAGLTRFIATPTVSKHRVFVWLDGETLPDHQLIVFARDDDFFFGVLQSSTHEAWARGMGTQLREVESGFRYTHTTTFETFPWPDVAADAREAVALAAQTLHTLRQGWLDADVPDEERPLRTLTDLYNQRPSWLANAHEELDQAVQMAYGWHPLLRGDQVLQELAALSEKRSSGA